MRIYLVNLKKFYGGGLFILASAILLGWGYLLSQFWGASPVVVPEPVYQGSEKEKKIALTMNVDGGEELLPVVLDITKDYDARITFFVSGRFAKEFSALIQEI
ncbi:MAG TPA: polysaccharide deacetylase family protein, partial [Clostridia bacterium]|nr:polysaccharide deacetylase family protein [Clostridia bacterium]